MFFGIRTRSKLDCASLIILGFTGIMGIGLPACPQVPVTRDSASAHRPVNVVTSISPLSDMVARIGGQHVSVTHFVPLGVDPHTYEPVLSSIKAVRRARVIFLNGDGLDSIAGRNLRTVRSLNSRVVDLSQSIPPALKNGVDPHYWLDPALARYYVKAIAVSLRDLDWAHAADYTRNADAYLQELESLDHRYRLLCSRVPPENRKLILYHNSWTYLATRYGFKIIGIVEHQEGQDPSCRHLAMLIRKAKAERVSAVLGEVRRNQKILETLKSEAGIPVVLYLVEDSLEQSPSDTYLGMMECNLQKLASEIHAR